MEAAVEVDPSLGVETAQCAHPNPDGCSVAAAAAARARWLWMDDAELKPSSSQLGSSVEEEAEGGRAAEYRNNRIPFLFIPPVRRCRCHHQRVT